MSTSKLKITYAALITFVICFIALHHNYTRTTGLCLMELGNVRVFCDLPTIERTKTSITFNNEIINKWQLREKLKTKEKLKAVGKNQTERRLRTELEQLTLLLDKWENEREKNKTRDKLSEDWLDRSDAAPFSNYGDGTCSLNPDRDVYKEILSEFISIMGNMKVEYFLSCGSLLGAWRNEDIIPDDRDLDVLVSHKDAEKIVAIADTRNFVESDNKFHLVIQEDWQLPYEERRRFKCNGKKVKAYSDHCSFQEPLARLIKGYYHIDIYDYKIKDGKVLDPSEFEKEYPVNDIFPLKKCKFMGIQAFCPKNPKLVMEKFYGKDLRPLKICENGDWVDR